VAIFAKPNIYICEKPEFHTSEIEILWLEVIINNLKAMVEVIYRTTHSDVSHWRKLENNIQPILDLNIPVILGDDLNIDMLGNQCGHLEDIRTRLNLENVVWEPTRVTHTSSTCIDLFMVRGAKRTQPKTTLDEQHGPQQKTTMDEQPGSNQQLQ
jgi:hypothetical protein